MLWTLEEIVSPVSIMRLSSDIVLCEWLRLNPLLLLFMARGRANDEFTKLPRGMLTKLALLDLRPNIEM